MSETFSFHVLKSDGRARVGEIATPHGVVRTPAFMPVGTQATVKGLRPDEVRATGTDIVLANIYHLMLRPGAERIAELGGLHRFMNWPDPILTDSGGFQVMSLSVLRRVDDSGVTFRSHLDGAMVDDGTACEVGIFYALMQSDPTKKGIAGLLTDLRSTRGHEGHGLNLFVEGCIEAGGRVCGSLDEVVEVLAGWRD